MRAVLKGFALPFITPSLGDLQLMHGFAQRKADADVLKNGYSPCACELLAIMGDYDGQPTNRCVDGFDKPRRLFAISGWLIKRLITPTTTMPQLIQIIHERYGFFPARPEDAILLQYHTMREVTEHSLVIAHEPVLTKMAGEDAYRNIVVRSDKNLSPVRRVCTVATNLLMQESEIVKYFFVFCVL
jgi:hypothetical protein